jgi:AraC-like DNA-binding protein
MKAILDDKTAITPESIALKIRLLHSEDPIATNYTSPHRKSSFEFLWLQQGTGTHVVNDLQIPFSANTMFCGSPGQLHHLKASTNFQACVINFNESLLYQTYENEFGGHDSNLFSLFSKFVVLRLERDVADEMNDIANKMLKESESNLLLNSEILRRYFKVFLFYILRQIERQYPTPSLPGNALVKSFLFAVNKEFRGKKLVMEYADDLSVSPNYLNQVVKRFSGKSAGYHIRQRIIAEAKMKAIHSGCNMKQIAYDLGFETPAHFSKFFKNYAGKNFSSFKGYDAGVHQAGHRASISC